MSGPGYAWSDLSSIRTADGQDERAGAVRGGFSADGHPPVGGWLSAVSPPRAVPASSVCWVAARIELRSGRVTPGSGTGSSSVTDWEEFGRSHPVRTALNLAQPS